MSSSYQLLDEPSPGNLQHLAVNPIWPLFGIMFGGAWLAFPWFALNAFAVGSPTRIKELSVAIFAFMGNAAILFTVFGLYESKYITDDYIKYAVQLVVFWKIGVAYWLYYLQSHTFELYEYFGGTVRNGVFVLAIAFVFMRERVIDIYDSPFWQLMVS